MHRLSTPAPHLLSVVSEMVVELDDIACGVENIYPRMVLRSVYLARYPSGSYIYPLLFWKRAHQRKQINPSEAAIEMQENIHEVPKSTP